MSGDDASTVTAGSSRPRPRTNSALANGAENRFICRKKKRPHKPDMWWFHKFFHLLGLCIALDKKGVYHIECKQKIDE